MKYFFLSLVIIITGYTASAEDLAMINRPVNIYGLTGILFTTSPYTLAPGIIEAGLSILSENSVKPEYRLTEYPVSVSIGLRDHSELSLRSAYIHYKKGPAGATGTERRSGDLDLSYKWFFLPQTEDSVVPGVALIVTGIVPTEANNDSDDTKINSMSHWGMKLGLSTGAEFDWKDHVLGIYADVQFAGQDLTEKRLRDVYEIVNAGLLFPVSKYQNLQMFIEYSLVHGREITNVDGGDYSGFTYGLRLVSNRFNLTMGTQFLHKNVEGYDNSGRVIGLMSLKF